MHTRVLSIIFFLLCVIKSSNGCQSFIFYSYDLNGNILGVYSYKLKFDQSHKDSDSFQYAYNSLNQMVAFKNNQTGQVYQYTYYPNGYRSAKSTQVNGIWEQIEFYYNHQGQLVNEAYIQNNQLLERSSYFAGLRFVDNLLKSNDSRLQFSLADRHNHQASLVFSKGQSQIESYHLTDYGQLAQSNSNTPESYQDQNQQQSFNFAMNPKVYGSGYYDSESNLHYMGARYYSEETQRFMAQDSYNLLNRYNYANANPVMNYDPDGHLSVSGILKEILPHDKMSAIIFGVSVVTVLGAIISPLVIDENLYVAATQLGRSGISRCERRLFGMRLFEAFEKDAFDQAPPDYYDAVNRGGFKSLIEYVNNSLSKFEGLIVKNAKTSNKSVLSAIYIEENYENQFSYNLVVKLDAMENSNRKQLIKFTEHHLLNEYYFEATINGYHPNTVEGIMGNELKFIAKNNKKVNVLNLIKDNGFSFPKPALNELSVTVPDGYDDSEVIYDSFIYNIKLNKSIGGYAPVEN